VQQADVPIPGAKIWFEGREFTAGCDGFAVIPFMSQSKHSVVAASATGGFACAKEVHFIEESWEVCTHVIAPHESYVPGCNTSVLLRCALFLSSHRLRVPLSELQSPSVSLDALDENNVVIQSSSSKITFNNSDDLLLPWTFPPGCCTLNVTLSASVALRSRVDSSVTIHARASAKLPFAPSYTGPSVDCETAALVQAASTRSDVITPHLRLVRRTYWFDVG
jgi:hypothetical protein